MLLGGLYKAYLCISIIWFLVDGLNIVLLILTYFEFLLSSTDFVKSEIVGNDSNLVLIGPAFTKEEMTSAAT